MSGFDDELSRLVRELNSLGGTTLPAVERDGAGRIPLDRLLGRVRETGASDLLLVAGVPPTARVDGRLLAIDPHPLDSRTVRGLVHELLDERLLRVMEQGAFAEFCFDRAGLGRFRCNAHHQRGSLAAAIRAFPPSLPELDALGLPAVVAKLAALERGLVLVAGPAGCGKTTTLAGII